MRFIFSLFFLMIVTGFYFVESYGESEIESSTYIDGKINRIGNSIVDFRNDIFVIVEGNVDGIPSSEGNIVLLKINSNLSEIISHKSFMTKGVSLSTLAIDSEGNVFVSGNTEQTTTEFPITPGAYLESTPSKYSYFILKFDNSLEQLLAGTFVGPSSFGITPFISIDAQDNVVLTGFTDSLDYPTTPGAYDETCTSDGIISKFSNDLTQLLASTCLGDSKKTNNITGQAVFDTDGNIYVTGRASDSTFPTTSNAYDTTFNGGANDVFVSKFNTDLTQLLSSTFLGSSGLESDPRLMLDNNGNVILALIGHSKSQYPSAAGFPTTDDAFSREFTGSSYEIIVSKLNSDLTTLLASTFINGNGEDHVSQPLIDSSNNVILIGTTQSTNFPITHDAFDSQTEESEVFVSVLDNSLSTLLSSSFLGGGSHDTVNQQTVIDNNGDLIIVGYTYSDDFPTTSGVLSREKTQEKTGFITKINLDIPTSSEIPEDNILKQIHSESVLGEIEIENYDVVLIPDSTETLKITGNIKVPTDNEVVLLVITHPDATKENRKVILNGNTFEKLYEIDSTFDEGAYEITGFYGEQQIGNVFFSLTKSLPLCNEVKYYADNEPEPEYEPQIEPCIPRPEPESVPPTIPEPEEIVCPQGLEPENGKCPDKPVVETPKELGIASFVDDSKDPQSYVDRYNKESSYREWFHGNYPQYDTIQQAVGLPEPAKEKVPVWIKNNAKWWSDGSIDDDTFVGGIQHLMKEKIVDIPDLPEQASEKARPNFVDDSKDPQHYLDRYNNEPDYKDWFDSNYPDYTIEEAVGVPVPIPGWIKNTASWWSEGMISEDEFIKGIEYLVENRILKVS